MGAGEWLHVGIKGKIIHEERGLVEKWLKTRVSQLTSRRKTPGVKTTQPFVNTTKNPPPGDQGLAFPNPLSTNHIVRAFYIRAQSPLWVVKNRVPTIGTVCGKGMRVGASGGGVNSLASRGSRSFLRFRRHAVVAPT